MSSDISFSADDFERYLNDNSFSASFDGESSGQGDGGSENGWMQKIDVSVFQNLTSDDIDVDLIADDVPSVENDVFVGNTNSSSPKKRKNKGYRKYEPSKKYRRLSSDSFGRQRQRKQDISNLSDDESDRKSGRKKKVGRRAKKLTSEGVGSNGKYPKPVYSYSSLIALALKNSPTGKMHVAEIYSFICDTFPFFRTAASGWKNSVRHNLSLSKSFEKIVVESPTEGRKYCLWALNKEKMGKINTEIRKAREKHPDTAKNAYANPGDIDAVEKGIKGTLKTVSRSSDLQSTTSSLESSMRAQDLGVKTVHAMIVEAAKAWEEKKARLECKIFTNSNGGRELGSYLKFTGSRTELQNNRPQKVVYNTKPLIFPTAKRGESDSFTDDEEEEKPVDYASRREHAFQKQLRQLHSVDMTPPRSSAPVLDAVSTPPPAGFSTPVRTPCRFHSSDSQWSPAFSFADYHRRQLWQLQNHTVTPEKSSGFFSGLDSRSGLSPLAVSIPVGNREANEGRKRNLQFATSLEYAFSASSPHNNSLIIQATAMQDQQFQQHHLSFGNVL